MISRRDAEEERGLFTGTGDQVPLAARQRSGLLGHEDYNRLQDRCNNVGKLLNALINSLKGKEWLCQRTENQALVTCHQAPTTRFQEPRKNQGLWSR
jgi:hypothetical protein